jgi:zinc protease
MISPSSRTVAPARTTPPRSAGISAALSLLCLWLLLLAPGVRALELPAGMQAGPSVEGVSQYQMENGLRIVLAPDASRPQTTVNMTYLVGSRQEGAGETGMAHLLEHLLFRGTDALPDAMAEFSRRGLAANGSTTPDRTNYYATFAAQPETLRWYLGWLADAIINARISREDLNAEMTVVRNEMERGENSPFSMLLQQISAASYVWHPYGRGTIGARSDVETVDIAQLRAFYHHYYQPDNAVLIVAGEFDIDQTLQWINESFSGIPRPERTLLPTYTVEPVQQGSRAVTLRRPGGSPIVAAQYHIPAGSSPDHIALDFAAQILTDTPSGYLTRKLVDTGLASSAFGYAAGLAEPAYMLFGAQLEPGGDADKTLHTLESELENLPADALDSAGLERVRTAWLSHWKRVYSQSGALASALSSAAALGDWRLFFLQREQVKALSLDDIRTQARTWLVPSNRTSGRYIPTADPHYAPLPRAADLTAMLSTLEENTPRPEIAAFDTSPAGIDAATQRSVLELPNGTVSLALLPKATGGDRVQAVMEIGFGSVDMLRDQGSIPSLTAAMLMRGAQGMSRQQIEDRLNELEAQANVSGDGNTVRIRMSTTHENLPALVDLVLHVLRTPTFPAEELEKIQRQAASSAENAMSNPGALALRTLQRYAQPWAPTDIRYTPTFEESLERIRAVTREDLQAFHDRFYGAGDIVLAAVGDFDPLALQDHLRAGLEGWKRAPAYTRVPEPWYATPPRTFEIPTPGKANASYLASLPLQLQDTDPLYPALLLGNYLLGGSQDARLWQRIRAKDGLSYDVGSTLQASSFEPSGSWSFYASMAPENAAALAQGVKDELAAVLRDGFSEEEVRNGIRSLLDYQKLARSSDGYLSSNWLAKLRTGRTFAWTQQMLDAVAALDAAQVNAALRATLDPDQLVIAVAAAPAADL